MTSAEDKPSIALQVSIGLANKTNRQVLRDFQDELEQEGYSTELDILPPSGQFSASLETIVITMGSGAGAALTALVVEDVYKGVKALVRKLVRRKKSDDNPEVIISIPIGQNFAVGVMVEADGKQVLNLLVRDVDNIKELPTRPDRPHGHDLS